MLSLEHSELTSFDFRMASTSLASGHCAGQAHAELPYGEIQAWINPVNQHWGITPLIRINGFLVNTGLAGMCVYDHMITMQVQEDFYHRYASMVKQSIIDHVPLRRRDDLEYISKYHGMSLDPQHQLVADIRRVLDA